MYSAAAGETARDRLRKDDPNVANSVYTRTLLPLLAKPRLTLPQLAQQVKREVIALAASQGEIQRPAYYDGVDTDYCLAGCVVEAKSPTAISEAERAWPWVKDTTDLVVLENFIKEFAETSFGALARARLLELREKKTALAAPTTEAVPATPDSAKRAFVVGNNRYNNLPGGSQLTVAVSDARAVAKTLHDLRFTVTLGQDLSRSEFNQMWTKFLSTIEDNSTAVVYFSGHGVDIEGLNYLIPRDIPFSMHSEAIRRESISVSEMLLDLRKRKLQALVLILDACRANPFVPAWSNPGAQIGGIARMEPPTGTFIMHAAGPGEMSSTAFLATIPMQPVR